MNVKIYKFCVNVLTILAITLIGYLSYLNITYNVFMDMKVLEIPEVTYSKPFYICLYLIIVLFVAVFIPKILNYIDEKNLFKLCTIAYLILGSYLIFNIEPELRSDAATVNIIAKEMSVGDFRNLETPGSYLFCYPHQLGLVSFFRILMKFSKNTVFLFFVYLLMVIAINYTIWKISEIYFKKNVLVRKITILISFLFLPQLFFICFLYGTIPGLVFVVLSTLFISRYFVGGKYRDCIIGILCMGIACILRNNYMIAGIALLISIFLRFLKKFDIKDIVIIALLLSCILFSSRFIKMCYEYESGNPINSGVPMIMYIVMGLQESEWDQNENGWYNGFVGYMYDEVGFDSEKATEVSIKIIQERMNEFIEKPAYMMEFFNGKARTTWCEPTFQSVWSGPLEECMQTTYTPILQSIYRGEFLYKVLNKYEKCILIIILFFSLTGIIVKRCLKKEDLNLYESFAVCYLIGGFLFHLFWETKSQYVYPYIFLLIPIAANGIAETAGIVKNLANSVKYYPHRGHNKAL